MSHPPKLATITLETGNNTVQSLAIDQDFGFLYAQVNTSPARIWKINMLTGQILGSLALPNIDSSNNNILWWSKQGQDDPDECGRRHGWLVAVSSNTLPLTLHLIRLSDFSLFATLEVSSHAMGTNQVPHYTTVTHISSANNRPVTGPAHAGVWTASAHLISAPPWIEAITYRALGLVRSGVMNSTGTTFYCGCRNIFIGDPGGIARILLSGTKFEVDNSLAFTDDVNIPFCAAIDSTDSFAYFGGQNSSGLGKLVKVNLTSFAISSVLSLSGVPTAATIDSANNFVYCVTEDNPSKVLKINVSTMTETSVLTLDAGETSGAGITIDLTNRFLYLGLAVNPGKVVQIALSTFTKVDTITFDTGEASVRSMAFDTANLTSYWGLNTSPGKIIPVGSRWVETCNPEPLVTPASIEEELVGSNVITKRLKKPPMPITRHKKGVLWRY